MAGYHRGVYRKQGGDEMVVASSGDITVESGGEITLQSGALLTLSSGSAFKVPVQTLGTSQTATNITNFGLSRLTGTTTGPTYTMAAPIVGYQKYLFLNATSSGVTHRAVVRSNSTGVSFDTTGGNQLTLATSALRGVSLVALTTDAWKIVGAYSGVSIAAARTT